MAIKVDLLPTERKKFGFDIIIALIAVLLVVAGIGFYFYGESLKSQIDTQQAKLAQIQKDIQKEKEGLPAIAELKKKNQELEVQINTVKTLRYDPIRYSNLLDEISILLPNNMWVSSISIEPVKRTVVLAGVAAEQPGVRPLESISGFMKSVNKSRYFRSATIASTTRGTTTVGKTPYTSYGWTIEMEYDPSAAEGNGVAVSPEKSEAKQEANLDTAREGVK